MLLFATFRMQPSCDVRACARVFAATRRRALPAHRLRLLPPLLGGGISAPYFQAVELKTNKSGIPSPTGPWIVGLLPLIAREFPHLLFMETVTPADLAGGADAARVGALKFRIAFRNERGTRNLSAEQERRLKELQKVDPSAVLAEPMDGARANENNAALCRLVRLI